VRLYLNTFRGEPAISRFDWHFTATHSSSEPSSTDTGPVLQSETIRPSTWPWVDHLVSGPLQQTNAPCSDSVSLRLRPYGGLTWPANVTRRFILQKARRRTGQAIVLRLLGDDWFQVLFHSPPGVLFTFPSRYWFAIGGQKYLALEGGPPGFPQGFSCPGVLGWCGRAEPPSTTGLSPSLVALSNAFV
jgi:hypothetical protein